MSQETSGGEGKAGYELDRRLTKNALWYTNLLTWAESELPANSPLQGRTAWRGRLAPNLWLLSLLVDKDRHTRRHLVRGYQLALQLSVTL
jgi:hypothetical protein